MRGWRAWVVAAVSCGVVGGASGVRAQAVGDVVREHVEKELEDDGGKKKKQKKKHEHEHDEKKSEKEHDSEPAPEPVPESEPEPPKDVEELPVRVLGPNFRFDIQLGAGYRGWVPQQYPDVDVSAGSYWTWSVDVKAKLFRFLNLRRGYYESNGLSAPRTDEAAVAAQVGSYVPKAAWLLGVLGFPFFKIWEPIIRYESRAFHTEAIPEKPVCIVTAEVADDLSKCVRSGKPLEMISGFETLVVGVRYDKSKDPSATLIKRDEKLPPLTFGIGLVQYRKPYQVTLNNDTLSGLLFDGRFRGAGLAFATEIAGGPDRFHANLDVQFGLGEVRLVEGLTLNSLAPEDWLMGYVQGNLTVGYHWPITRGAPTLMLVPQLTGGGACFFFFKPNQDEHENADAETANWDFLWSVNASLVLSL
ncbi:MAG TPA: hypothetical protein VJV78_30525 [Polyangiales bacterium]|nr:hypothetical protein [Polyangiales bacterium]